jgi:hypothetical protein
MPQPDQRHRGEDQEGLRLAAEVGSLGQGEHTTGDRPGPISRAGHGDGRERPAAEATGRRRGRPAGTGWQGARRPRPEVAQAARRHDARARAGSPRVRTSSRTGAWPISPLPGSGPRPSRKVRRAGPGSCVDHHTPGAMAPLARRRSLGLSGAPIRNVPSGTRAILLLRAVGAAAASRGWRFSVPWAGVPSRSSPRGSGRSARRSRPAANRSSSRSGGARS